MDSVAHILVVFVGVEGVVAAIFGLLYRRDRLLYLRRWAAAWWAGVGAMALWLVHHLAGASVQLETLAVVATLPAHLFLATGALSYVGRAVPRSWSPLAVGAGSVALGAWGIGAAPVWATLPVAAVAVAILLWAGGLVLRCRRGEPGAGVIGWGLVSWGAHLGLYGFAAASPVALSWLLSAAGLLKLLIAAGILVVHFEREGRRLRTAQAVYQTLFEEAVEGLFSLDAAGRILRANPAMAQMVGRQSLVGEDFCSDLLVESSGKEEHGALLTKLVASSAAAGTAVELRHADGTRVAAILRVRCHGGGNGEGAKGYHGYLRDVSRERRLQSQLAEAREMEAVGRLASGVAHDFNNILAAISGYASLIETSPTLGPEDRADVAGLQASVARGASLTRRLLAVRDKGAGTPSLFNLGGTVAGASALLRRAAGSRLRLTVDLTPTATRVFLDRERLEQALMDWVTYVAEHGREGDEIVVTTLVDDLDVAAAARVGPLEAGPHVRLDIRRLSSAAPGVDDPVAEGDGIALSAARRLIRNAGGHVVAGSTPSGCTGVTVFLPLQRSAGEPPPTLLPSDAPLALLVEDEEAVCEALARTLQAAGCRVLTADAGGSALELGRECGRQIALLVTDLNLVGDIGGVELGRKLRAENRDLRVIYMSGRPWDFEDPPPRDAGEIFLEKPFSMTSFQQRVRELLG